MKTRIQKRSSGDIVWYNAEVLLEKSVGPPWNRTTKSYWAPLDTTLTPDLVILSAVVYSKDLESITNKLNEWRVYHGFCKKEYLCLSE
jgi:hypothetical protein